MNKNMKILEYCFSRGHSEIQIYCCKKRNSQIFEKNPIKENTYFKFLLILKKVFIQYGIT